MPKFSRAEINKIMRPLPPSIRRENSSRPIIPKSSINLSGLNDGLFLQSFMKCSLKDRYCKNKIVHFFAYDRFLDPLYEYPERLIPRLAKYYAVRTPDYSRFEGMDRICIQQAVFKNRYLGALWSSYGRKIIPTIGWTTPEFYDICFEGVEKESVVSISTLGVHSSLRARKLFLDGYNEMCRRLEPSSIICLGDWVEGMDTEKVYFVPYQDSFGNQYQKGWQTRLFDVNDASKGDN